MWKLKNNIDNLLPLLILFELTNIIDRKIQMNYSTVSLVLAQALIKLPRITMSDLFDQCKIQPDHGSIGLAEFRLKVAAWLSDGTIPGYESRKGKTGGIYKKGSKTESNTKEPVELSIDHIPIAEMLDGILNNQTHITAGNLFILVSSSIPNITEAQFRPLLSRWLHDGTIPGYEIRKGLTGGIYRIGTTSDKYIPTTFDSEDTEHSEGSFTVEISPTIRVIRSDERNWAIQKKSGENWLSRFYHPTLLSALNSCVRHILNNEFKLADSTMVHIKDTIKVLREIEKRIETILNKQANTEAA